MTQENKPASTPPAKKSLRGKIIKIVVSILVLILLLVLLLPTLLSTGPGNSFLLGKVNAGIAGKVEADSISLGWFTGQSITGVQVLDPDSKTVISIDKIDLPGAGLFGLATGGRDLGAITVNKPVVNFTQNADGTSNIDAAFAPKKAAKAKSSGGGSGEKSSGPFVFPEPKLAFSLDVIDGQIIAETPSLPRTTVDSFVLKVVMASITSIDVKSSAKIIQDPHKGEWSADVTATDLFASDGTMQLDKMTLKSDASLTGIPIALVDAMAKQNGKLVALLGEKLDAKVNANGTLANLNGNIDAKSQTLTVNSAVTSNSTGLTLAPGSKIKLDVSPAAWDALTKAPGQTAQAKLKAPFTLDLSIAKIAMPKSGDKLDWIHAAIDTKINLTTITLLAPAPVGEVTLSDTSLSAKTENLQKSTAITFSAKAKHSDLNGTVNLKTDVGNPLTNEGKFNESGVTAKIDGSITQLPLALVDEFAKTKGLITRALGKTLDATVTADIQPTADGKSVSGPFSIKANSGTPGISGAPLIVDLSGDVKENTLTLNKNGSVTYTIQPDFVKELATFKDEKGKAKSPAYSLINPAALKVTINSLSLPFAETARGNAALSAMLSLDKVELRDAGTLGDFTLSQTSVSLDSAKISDSITFKAGSQLARGSGQTASIDANGKIVSAVNASGAGTPDQAAFTVLAKVKDLPTALIDLFMQTPEQPNRAQTTLGPLVNLEINANATPIKDAKNSSAGSQTTFIVTANSETLTLNSSGSLTPTLFSLDPDKTSLTFTLKPDAARTLANQKDESSKLKDVLLAPSVLTIKIPKLTLPLPYTTPDTITAAFDVGINEIVPADAMLPPDLKGTRISDLKLALKETRFSETLLPKLSANLATPLDPAVIPLTASASVKNAGKETQAVDVIAEFNKFPVGLVDTLAKQQGKLTLTLGPVLTKMKLGATIAKSKDKADSYIVSAEVESARMSANLGATYVQDESLIVKEGSKLSLNLSPEAYAAWTPQNNAGLTQNGDSPFALTSRDTQIIWKKVVGPDGKPISVIDAANSRAKLDLTCSAAFLQSDKTNSMGLNDVLVNLDSPSLAKEIGIRVQGTAFTAGPTISGGKKTSKIESTVKLANALSDGMKLDLKKATIDATANMPNIPVAAVDAMLHKNGDLLDLLGESASLTAKISSAPNIGGPVDLDLQSGNLKVNTKGALDKDMNLKLREDAIAMLTITPQIATKYLAKLSPVLKDVKSAKDPVKVSIYKDVFFYPLQQSDPTKPVVRGSLALGTMHMKRSEISGYLVKGIRAAGSTIQDREEFDAKFTVLEFLMKDGVVTSNDVWFDAGDVILGTQARVNLAAKPEATAEVLLCMPGEFVRLIPGAHKRVPVEAEYAIQGAGPLSKIEYDTVQIAAEFAKIGAAASGNKYVSQAADGLSLLSAAGSALSGDKEKKDKEKLGLKGWAGAKWPNRPKTDRAPVVEAKTPAEGQPAPTGATPAPANNAAPAPTATPSKTAPASSEQGLLESLLKKAEPKDKTAAPKPASPESSAPAPTPTEKPKAAAPTPAPTPAPVQVPEKTKAPAAAEEKPKAPAAAPAPAPVPVPPPVKTKAPTEEKPKAPAAAPAPAPAPEEKPNAKATAPEKTPTERPRSRPAAPSSDAESSTTQPAEATPAPAKPVKRK